MYYVMNLRYIIHNHISRIFIISLFSLLSFKLTINFNIDGITRKYKDGKASNNIKQQKFITTKIHSAITGNNFWNYFKTPYEVSSQDKNYPNSNNLFCLFSWQYINEVNMTYSRYRAPTTQILENVEVLRTAF